MEGKLDILKKPPKSKAAKDMDKLKKMAAQVSSKTGYLTQFLNPIGFPLWLGFLDLSPC